jgi:hypothetical protein
MKTVDFLLIIHLVTAVIFVFPLIGIVSYFSGKTYQRRLQTLNKNSNKKKVNFFYSLDEIMFLWDVGYQVW